MENKDLYQLAKTHYLELKTIVEENKNTSLKELCKKLCGHNLDEELFDVNYGCLCATIIKKDNILTLQKDVEIWNDKECIMLEQNYIMED